MSQTSTWLLGLHRALYRGLLPDLKATTTLVPGDPGLASVLLTSSDFPEQ